MRQRKIRGHNRRIRQVDNWRLENLSIDLNSYLLNDCDYYYTKIRVNPWGGISLTNSGIPEPSGKTRQKIIKALVDIYENWKIQLDQSGQPYYLKIWFFEPRFSQSQVVCAINDRINFYKNTFFKPEHEKLFKHKNYGTMQLMLEKFNWDHRLDEDYFDNTTVGEPGDYASDEDYKETQKWFAKLMNKPHRTKIFKEQIGEITESYSFQRGDIWLGELK